MNTRKSIFSGSWYPASASACEREITEFLAERGIEKIDEPNLKGGIVPHAGWFFSGSIACNVIHALSKTAVKPDVIVVFGMHLHTSSPPHIMAEGSWETPFGPLKIAAPLAEALTEKFDFVVETTKRFSQDNTIELQLPFIKYFFKDASILPIGVPPSDTALEIARETVKSANGLNLKLKIIGSTDLSHYGPNYGYTSFGTGKAALDKIKNEIDAAIIEKMVAMDPAEVISEALENQNACCAGAAAASIEAAKNLGASRAKKIAYRTSNDKHPGDSFVGYAGIVF